MISIIAVAFATSTYAMAPFHRQPVVDDGQWSDKINWHQIGSTVFKGMAIHMALMPDGRLIIWNWRKPDDSDDTSPDTDFKVWAVSDATGGSETPYNYKVLTEIAFDSTGDYKSQIFCAGQTWTYDGKLFVAGGHRLFSLIYDLHGGSNWGGFGTYQFDPNAG